VAGGVAAAWAHYEAEGLESMAAAHAACADEVRRLVPFLDLAGGHPLPIDIAGIRPAH